MSFEIIDNTFQVIVLAPRLSPRLSPRLPAQ